MSGTDSAKGVINTDLAYELAMDIGRAAAMVSGKGDKRRPKILIGKDTRIPSDMFESALAMGLCSVGMNVVHLGIVPTPTVTYLVRKYGANTGVMISASHNPCKSSDIKIFSNTGYKLPNTLEERIEAIMFDHEEKPQFPTGGEVDPISATLQALWDYMDHVKSTVPEDILKGLRIALDCTSDSSAMTARTLLTELGAECHMLSDAPNGVSINDNCNSTYMETLMQCVKASHMDAGLAFDDDADRCLAMDEQGQLVDGGFLTAIYAPDPKSQGRLAKSAAVGTIMTSMGFVRFYEKNGIKFAAIKVDDRYVLEEILQGGYNFDGEQSEHVIFLDHTTMGSDQMAGVQLLTILNRRRAHLSSLATLMIRYPQVMVNMTVSREGELRFYTGTEVDEAIEHAKARLGVKGRVVVHPSGTELLLCVMIEGENHSEISALAHGVADVVRERLA